MTELLNVRRGVSEWGYTIDLSEWFAPSVEPHDAMTGIYETLWACRWVQRDNPGHYHTGRSLRGIVENMEGMFSPTDFDALLNLVYDIADRNRVRIITS